MWVGGGIAHLARSMYIQMQSMTDVVHLFNIHTYIHIHAPQVHVVILVVCRVDVLVELSQCGERVPRVDKDDGVLIVCFYWVGLDNAKR